MLKLYIVLLSIEKFDRRRTAERIEGNTFLSFDELIETIKPTKYVDIDTVLLEEGDFCYYELTDFMDLCNNEEFDIDNYWISYVFVGNSDVSIIKKEIERVEEKI